MESGESWKWDPAPGYDPTVHCAIPFALSCVPLVRAVQVQGGQIISDSSTAFLVGLNRAVLQQHAAWLQGVVDCARQAVPGFHRDFAVEAHKIPDFPEIPPPEMGLFEALAWPGTVSLAPLTKTGKVAKYPLSVAFLIFSDVLVRPDGFFVRVMDGRSQRADETVARLSYLSSGVVGKASVQCWRNNTRWSVDCVTKDGQIVIARIERGDPSGDVTRFYDYQSA